MTRKGKKLSLIRTYLNADGELLFTYRSLPANKIYNVSYCDDETVMKKRAEYEKNNLIQRSFVKYLAAKGAMDGIFPKAVVRSACNNGARPRNYQVHHIVPLCCGGDNSFDNLMLVHKDVHAEIHNRIWKDIYNILKQNKQQQACAYIPKLPIVMTPREQIYLLDTEEIEYLLLSEKSKRSRQSYNNAKHICCHNAKEKKYCKDSNFRRGGRG